MAAAAAFRKNPVNYRAACAPLIAELLAGTRWMNEWTDGLGVEEQGNTSTRSWIESNETGKIAELSAVTELN